MSTEDCRNDCTPPLSFPRRLFNRPGLSHIDFRIGNYADIREALLRRLDQSATLSAWTHRGADDPGIALLEGAAILGDILTFYQELYANEAYLRTALWRESIGDLVRLLGYRLSPGLGGQATFAFELKGAKAVSVPKNFPLKAEVTGLSKPADFETSDALTAYPWLSRFNLFRPLLWPDVTPATSEFYIETPDQRATPVELKRGDRLLLGDAASSDPSRLDNAEVVIVDSTRVLHGVTLVKIKGSLRRSTNAPGLAAFKLGRTFRHFGHNGPQKKVIPPPTVTARSTTLATTIQPPAMRVELDPVPIPAHPPVQPPELTVEPDELTIVADVAKVPPLTITPAVTLTSGPRPTGLTSATVTIRPPSVTVLPPPVPVPSPTEKIQPPPATVRPPLLPIPPALLTTTTDIPPPTEVSINFFRWLNRPANPLESVWSIIEPNLDMKEFPLDAEVQDLPAGVPLVAQFTAYINASRTQKEERTLVRTIASVKPIYMTWGLLTSNTSLVTLKETIETPPLTVYLYADIREFQLHETLSPQLTLKAEPQEAPLTSGNELLFFGTDSEAQDLKGRRLFFEPPGKEAFTATVISVETEPAPLLEPRPRVRAVVLSRKSGLTFTYADFPNEKPTVNVFGNLADATQGKTEAETALGGGDSRQVFQLFKVPKSPLTYLLATGNTPPETPELEIYVNERRWQLVPTFFGHKYDEEIYIVREDAAGDSWVQFGDGKTGARLPSGIRNVTAKFRTGTGAYGALKPGTKVQGGARLEKLDKIQMPGVAAGGSTPEDGDNAREAAPGKIQSLGRLVSLKDFESETLAISGVVRASSSWELEENVATVFVTVLMETGREEEIATVQQVLAGYNICRGPQRFPVRVREGRLLYVSVDVTYGLAPTYRAEVVTAAIKQALGASNLTPAAARGLFHVRGRRFGQNEYATTVEGAVQNVAGVLWAQVNDFTLLGEAFAPPFDPAGLAVDPATLPLPATKTPNDKIACDSLHMLALHSRHLVVNVAVETNTEVCG
jgi:hypothetical protein